MQFNYLINYLFILKIFLFFFVFFIFIFILMSFDLEKFPFFIIYSFFDCVKGVISFLGFIYFFNLFEDYQVFLIMIIYSIIKIIIFFLFYYKSNKDIIQSDIYNIKRNLTDILIISLSPVLIQLITLQFLKQQLTFCSPLLSLDSGFFYFLTVLIVSNKKLNIDFIFRQNIFLLIIGFFSIFNLIFIYYMEDYTFKTFLFQKIPILFLCQIINGIQEVIEKYLISKEEIKINIILIFQGIFSFCFYLILFIQNIICVKVIPINYFVLFFFKTFITIIFLLSTEYFKLKINQFYNPLFKGFSNNISAFFILLVLSIYIHNYLIIINTFLLLLIGTLSGIFVLYFFNKEDNVINYVLDYENLISKSINDSNVTNENTIVSEENTV